MEKKRSFDVEYMEGATYRKKGKFLKMEGMPSFIPHGHECWIMNEKVSSAMAFLQRNSARPC